jgi:hypothetical protein
MFAKLITEKESSDDYHAIEKAKSKRIQKKWNLLNFYKLTTLLGEAC